MKALHVIPSVAAVRGGPSVMVRTLARGLAQGGVESHVATTDDNGAGRLDVRRGMPVEDQGATYWHFERQSRFYTFSWPLTTWLARNVSNYDVVHIHALFSYAAAPAAYWARRYAVPYVVRPLGVLNRWGMANRRPLLKRLSFRLLESRILRHAALIHFTSEQERDEAMDLQLKTRSIIIPNPLPSQPAPAAPGMFRAQHPELRNRKILLFLSRFDRKKGLDLLLEAFAQVRQAAPDTVLVLAGEGDPTLTAELRCQAERLGIASDVFWPGFLKGEAKLAAMADADLFVLPSYSENFGIAVIEAMAAGLAVVVSDQVGIHGEIVEAQAGEAVSCDSGALSRSLLRLLDNPPLRKEMGFNGKCLTQTKYSLETVTEQLIAAYTEIAN